MLCSNLRSALCRRQTAEMWGFWLRPTQRGHQARLAFSDPGRTAQRAKGAADPVPKAAAAREKSYQGDGAVPRHPSRGEPANRQNGGQRYFFSLCETCLAGEWTEVLSSSRVCANFVAVFFFAARCSQNVLSSCSRYFCRRAPRRCASVPTHRDDCFASRRHYRWRYRTARSR